MSKRSFSPLNTMLKMGLLCVGVLVALALTSPSPPLSDAASKQELAANDMARAQLEQLKQEMLQGLNPDGQPGDTPVLAVELPEDLSPEQEEELRRIRERLVLSQEPLNLVEEPQDSTLDDPALAALAELQIQAQEQAKTVEPFINQELEDKRAQLAAEEARLRLERQSMEQLKEDIDRRLAELKELQQAVEAVTNLQDQAQSARQDTIMSEEQRQAKVVQVSKMISQMKPAAAARVFEHLTNGFAVEVMSQISPRIAGKIMNVMDPVKAATISAIMAKEQQVAQARQTEAELEQEIQAAMQNAGQAAQNAANASQPAPPQQNPADTNPPAPQQ